MNKHAQLFAILNRIGKTKEEAVHEFTGGRTTSLGALSAGEYNELMSRLARHNIIPPGDAQRKKMISIARQMRWGKNTKEIISAINGWLLKQKYEKPLMQLDLDQLNRMLNIFETKVYADYLKALNK